MNFGCATKEEQKVSNAGKEPIIISSVGLKILADRKYNVDDISNRTDVIVLNEGDVETITFTPPVIMCDGMTHVIRINHRNKQYWIIRSGGIGGINQETGPYGIK